MIARALVAVAVVANPVVAVVAAGVVVMGRGWSLRVAGRVCAAASGVVAVVVGLAGRAYLAPYRQVVRQVAAGGLLGARQAVVEAAVVRWPEWLLDQLPVGVPAGVAVGAGVVVLRARLRAGWRDSRPRLSERQVVARLRQMTATDRRGPAAGIGDLVVRLGVDVVSGAASVVPGAALRQHLFLAGASGYGKSRTIEQLLRELVVTEHARGLMIPVLFADMKADPGLLDAMAGAAHTAGRRFRLVTVTGRGESYNPIRRGSPEQVRSRIVESLDQVAGGGFSEPHHREAAEEFVLYAVRVLDDLVAQGVEGRFGEAVRVWRRDLPDLACLMSVQALHEQLHRVTPALAADVEAYLSYLAAEARDLRRSIPGLAARVRNMVSGDAGRVLTEDPDGIDLYDSIRQGDVVLLSLASASDARASRQIGNLWLTDLGSVGDRLAAEDYAVGGGLFIAGVDEFSALGGSTLAALFQRLRGAGGGLMLCTQDLADLADVSPAFRAAVLTNSNVWILHRQRAAADDLANLIGTHETWEETLQVQEDLGVLGPVTAGTGAGALRRTDQHLVHPAVLRRLPLGHAVVSVGHPVDTLQTVRVLLAPRLSVPATPTRAPARPAPDVPAVELSKALPPLVAPSSAPVAEGEDLW